MSDTMSNASRDPKPNEITTDEWLAELRRVYSREDAEGYTAQEIADALDISTCYARRRLREAIRAGTWECAGTAERSRIDGRPCRKPVYRPIEKGKSHEG